MWWCNTRTSQNFNHLLFFGEKGGSTKHYNDAPLFTTSVVLYLITKICIVCRVWFDSPNTNGLNTRLPGLRCCQGYWSLSTNWAPSSLPHNCRGGGGVLVPQPSAVGTPALTFGSIHKKGFAYGTLLLAHSQRDLYIN